MLLLAWDSHCMIILCMQRGPLRVTQQQFGGGVPLYSLCTHLDLPQAWPMTHMHVHATTTMPLPCHHASECMWPKAHRFEQWEVQDLAKEGHAAQELQDCWEEFAEEQPEAVRLQCESSNGPAIHHDCAASQVEA